jgi:hypothetical protein
MPRIFIFRTFDYLSEVENFRACIFRGCGNIRYMKALTKTSRRIPEEQAASLEEIEVAISALTKDQLHRLRAFAHWRVERLGRASLGRSEEDLLQEAVKSICIGANSATNGRRWNKDAVDFFGFLIGVIKSISSHWREQFDDDEAWLESDVICKNSDGVEQNPMLNVTSPANDGRRATWARHYVEHIEKIISVRPLAALILEGMKDCMTGPEIKDALNLSKKDYETEMKWIRRTVRADARRENTDGK